MPDAMYRVPTSVMFVGTVYMPSVLSILDTINHYYLALQRCVRFLKVLYR